MLVPSVCHYSFSSSGGAGRVASQLSRGLNDFGIQSYVESVTDGDIRDCALRHPILTGQALFDYFFVRKSRDQSLFTLYRKAGSGEFKSHKNLVHHLHWTPGVAGLTQIKNLIQSDSPTVWTLHDMWPFTGGCHYSMECDHFTKNCNGCPQVRGIFSRSVGERYQSKKQMFMGSKSFVAVTPSRWLRNQAEQSGMFTNCQFEVISNPIDTDIFLPNEHSQVLKSMELVVGCNTVNLNDPIKGVDTLIYTLEKFQDQHPDLKVKLLAIGRGDISSKKIEIATTGYLSDQSQIATSYLQMDIFVSLATAEVYPLSIAEAQSCGIPVICLNSGGMPEMIRENINGFVIQDPPELLRALERFADSEVSRVEMAVAARRHAVANYSTQVVVKKYSDIYSGLISETTDL
jgi:glycosyltransferase involved in cell wall biosynthesis